MEPSTLGRSAVCGETFRQLVSRLIRSDAIVGRDQLPFVEMIGPSVRFTQPGPYFIYFPVNRPSSAVYACAETMWYLLIAYRDKLSDQPAIFERHNRAQFIMRYAPSYSKYLNTCYQEKPDFNKITYDYGNYGERIGSQIDSAIRELTYTNNSRRAVITIRSAADLTTGLITDVNDVPFKDIPCTSTIQLLLRDDQLHMVVNMRSNDLWKGFIYDVFAFSMIQSMIASRLGVSTGSYTHQVGSLHLYLENEATVEHYHALESEIPPNDTVFPSKSSNLLMMMNESVKLSESLDACGKIITQCSADLLQLSEEAISLLQAVEFQRYGWQLKTLTLGCVAPALARDLPLLTTLVNNNVPNKIFGDHIISDAQHIRLARLDAAKKKAGK